VKGLVWLRRDLRLHDHTALAMATRECDEVYLVFVFDKNILDKLTDPKDRRLSFIYESLKEIDDHAGVHVLYGDPVQEIPRLIKKLGCQTLFFNRDYEPYARQRDEKIIALVDDCRTYKDSIFLEPHEVLKSDGKPYTVFTPYKRRWLEAFLSQDKMVSDFKVKKNKIGPGNNKLSPKFLKNMGFELIENVMIGGTSEALKKLKKFDRKMDAYHKTRDFPAIDGTSNLSTYIRHGCLSVRDIIRSSLLKKNLGRETWLSEIIWREFYHMILYQFPHVAKKEFKEKYEGIVWNRTNKEFKDWCEGKTGFPLIDSAMRCLKETGLMPNRLRMVASSFLCKTLLINWQKGERYFALKLLDFDLASNNGGWQWSASTGCDAQPYFRIFNPYTQSEKFDGEGEFIKKWCPELSGFSSKRIHNPAKADMLEQAEAKCTLGKDYPFPIVDYSSSRQRALSMYKRALTKV
jgi:deoxyribodipyrimidine photo-lyase